MSFIAYCVVDITQSSNTGTHFADYCSNQIMEEFIQHKDLLLTKYEYAGGDAPSPKTNKERHKLVKNGKAKIIKDDYKC